jgi:hypothetical protein
MMPVVASGAAATATLQKYYIRSKETGDSLGEVKYGVLAVLSAIRK